jgi:hypothetical protein
MANLKCPGRGMVRNLDSVMVTCDSCGRKVEFFTDEIKRTCRCGRTLFQEARPQCADWCPAAARCLGEIVDVRQGEGRRRPGASPPEGKVNLERMRKRSTGKNANAAKP